MGEHIPKQPLISDDDARSCGECAFWRAKWGEKGICTLHNLKIKTDFGIPRHVQTWKTDFCPSFRFDKNSGKIDGVKRMGGYIPHKETRGRPRKSNPDDVSVYVKPIGK